MLNAGGHVGLTNRSIDPKRRLPAFNRNDLLRHSGGGNLAGDFASIISRPALNDAKQMRPPQELVDHCSVVAATRLAARCRHDLLNGISLNDERAKKWCSAIRPGTDSVSHFVCTLTPQRHRWFGTVFWDTILDHFSRHVENYSSPGSFGRHFVRYEPSLRSLCPIPTLMIADL